MSNKTLKHFCKCFSMLNVFNYEKSQRTLHVGNVRQNNVHGYM